MRVEERTVVEIKLPHTDPDVLELLGYRIDREGKVVVEWVSAWGTRCERGEILSSGWAVFKCSRKLSTEELKHFEKLESGEIPWWAVRLAGAVVELQREIKSLKQ